MGLDQFAVTYRPEQVGTLQVDIEAEQVSDICQWRKHPNLHGWMEQLYRSKGGLQEFNCTTVRLDAADIDALEKAVLAEALPKTDGFFFGQSRAENKAEDLEFIAEARKAIAAGLVVAYDSWW